MATSEFWPKIIDQRQAVAHLQVSIARGSPLIRNTPIKEDQGHPVMTGRCVDTATVDKAHLRLQVQITAAKATSKDIASADETAGVNHRAAATEEEVGGVTTTSVIDTIRLPQALPEIVDKEMR